MILQSNLQNLQSTKSQSNNNSITTILGKPCTASAQGMDTHKSQVNPVSVAISGKFMVPKELNVNNHYKNIFATRKEIKTYIRTQLGQTMYTLNNAPYKMVTPDSLENLQSDTFINFGLLRHLINRTTHMNSFRFVRNYYYKCAKSLITFCTMMGSKAKASKSFIQMVLDFYNELKKDYPEADFKLEQPYHLGYDVNGLIALKGDQNSRRNINSPIYYEFVTFKDNYSEQLYLGLMKVTFKEASHYFISENFQEVMQQPTKEDKEAKEIREMITQYKQRSKIATKPIISRISSTESTNESSEGITPIKKEMSDTIVEAIENDETPYVQTSKERNWYKKKAKPEEKIFYSTFTPSYIAMNQNQVQDYLNQLKQKSEISDQQFKDIQEVINLYRTEYEIYELGPYYPAAMKVLSLIEAEHPNIKYG